MQLSLTKPKYRFTLLSELRDVVCDHFPAEYKTMKYSLDRDWNFAGVFEELKISSLTFTGQAERELLIDLEDQRGLRFICSLRIEQRDVNRVYQKIAEDFKINPKSFREVKTKKSRNAVRVNVQKDDVSQKLSDRKGIKVDIGKTTSLGEFEIVIKDHWTNLKKDLLTPELQIFRSADFSGVVESSDVDRNLNISIPMIPTTSDYTETNEVELIEQVADPDINFALYSSGTLARIFEINGTVEVTFIADTAIGATLIVKYARLDSDGTTLHDEVTLGSFPVAAGQTESVNFSKILLPAETIQEEESFIIWCQGFRSSGSFLFEYTANTTINISSQDTTSQETTIETYPILEFTERNLQLILDMQYPLLTNLFGRVDVVYNSNGDTYPTENQERFANVLNGYLARGLLLDDNNNSVAVSFKDTFKALNAAWNVGIEVEDEKIRLEERAHFFQDALGFDLSDRINDLEIEREILDDFAYTSIFSGYKSFEYLGVNGRGEYNTTQERTTVLPDSKKFDNVSPYRGDTYGFSLLLAKPIVSNVQQTESTTDVKGEKDIFLFKSQRLVDNWQVETDENREVKNNTSLFQGNSLNLFLTPAVTLFRHNYELASGLDKEQDTFLRFQDSDKLQTLETDLVGGGDIIVENEDILVSDLGDPKWKAAQFIVTVEPFYAADLAILRANKNKLIRLTSTKQGWLLKGDYDIIGNKIELFILEKF